MVESATADSTSASDTLDALIPAAGGNGLSPLHKLRQLSQASLLWQTGFNSHGIWCCSCSLGAYVGFYVTNDLRFPA